MTTGDEIVAFAAQQIGKPYVFGATGPNSFDCSGLALAACAAAGIKISRTTYTQITEGSAVDKGSLAPGDLVFPDIGHVQIYAGNGQVIEAPHSGAQVRQVNMWGFLAGRRVAVPGSVHLQTVGAGGTGTQPVGLADFIPAFSVIEKISKLLSDPTFWRRIGMGAVGLVLVALGIAFVNRKKIETQVNSAIETGKTAAKIAAVA